MGRLTACARSKQENGFFLTFKNVFLHIVVDGSSSEGVGAGAGVLCCEARGKRGESAMSSDVFPCLPMSELKSHIIKMLHFMTEGPLLITVSSRDNLNFLHS